MKIHPDEEFIRCRKCKNVYGYWEYAVINIDGRPSYRRNTCKSCRKKYDRQNRKKQTKQWRDRYRHNGWSYRARNHNRRDPQGGDLTGEQLKSLWEASKGVCYYCKKEITGRRITFDHYVPLALGGRTTIENMRVCCQSCNSRKKAMPGEGFELLLKTGAPF